MLTVGLAKELYFIAHCFTGTLSAEIKLEGLPRALKIKMSAAGHMDVFYGEEHIWQECIEGDTSFFGVESCDTIARIIACIANGSDWSQYRWTEKR